MEFTCNDPIRGDKIARLADRVCLVLHKEEGDAYFLIDGMVSRKEVQLDYSTSAGHDRMSITLENETIQLIRTSISVGKSPEEQGQDPQLESIPALISKSTVCDIYDDQGQAISEYGVLMPNTIFNRPRPMSSPHYGTPGFNRSDFGHAPTRRG